MCYLLGSLALLIASVFYINAQTVDTAILGTVLDPAGAPVSGATVTILQPTTGFSHGSVTSQEGTYEARYLVPGEYVVETGPAGFRRERRTGIVIQLGQQARIDFSLKVGTVEETMEVDAGVPLLQTENATIAGVVDQERIESLPINGRRFDDLAVLTPGVIVYNPDLHSSSTDGSEISGNGGRSIWGQVNVDGITMVNNRHNYVNVYPSLDAIEEFKVQTGNYSAEYGEMPARTSTFRSSPEPKSSTAICSSSSATKPWMPAIISCRLRSPKTNCARISLGGLWAVRSGKTRPFSLPAMKGFVPSLTPPARGSF